MCSIPKSIVDFASLHGVGTPRVKPRWYPFMEQCQLKSVHTKGELLRAHLDGNTPHFVDGCVPRVRLKNKYLNDHYDFHLVLSPRESPTSPNPPWGLASVFGPEFDFTGYASHHFEDPYLMTTNDQVEHTLKMVCEIQGSTRVIFQLSTWVLHWMTSVAILTRLSRRHVTRLVTIRASICGQIAFKRRGMIRTRGAIGVKP